MLIHKEQYQFTNKMTQKNFKIPFTLAKEYEQLIIQMTYGPSHSEDQAARQQVSEAIEKYIPVEASKEAFDVETFLPVENFITLSLSKDNKYLGGHHNKAKSQKITISKEKASLGFWPTKIEKADWELQLNFHCLASLEAYVDITIEVSES